MKLLNTMGTKFWWLDDDGGPPAAGTHPWIARLLYENSKTQVTHTRTHKSC